MKAPPDSEFHATRPRKRRPPQPKQETLDLCRELRKAERWTVRVIAERSNPALVTKYLFEGHGKTASAAIGHARKRFLNAMRSDLLVKHMLFSDEAEALTLERAARTEGQDPTQMLKTIQWVDDPTKPVGHPRRHIAEAADLKAAGWTWTQIYERFGIEKQNRARAHGLRGSTPLTQRAKFRLKVKKAMRRKYRKSRLIQRLKKLFPGPFPYQYEVSIKFLGPGEKRPLVFAHRSILPLLPARAYPLRLPISPQGGA